MPTAYQALRHFCKKKNIPLPNQQARIELGKQLADIYHKSEIKIPIYRIPQVEEKEKYNVLAYPKAFIPKMDAFFHSQLISEKP